MAAAFGVEIALVHVRAQQREHRTVALGEIRPGPAEKEQPQGPAGPSGQPCRIGQEQLELMLDPLWPVNVGVHAGAVPLSGRVEVRDLYDTAQVPGAEAVERQRRSVDGIVARWF